MKSVIWCVCVSASLFVAVVASGSIQYDGDWSGSGGASGYWGYTNADATADGDDPSDWEAGEGELYVWTTEAARCDWDWDCRSYAQYYIFWYEGGTCTATAGASASVSFPGGSDGTYAEVPTSKPEEYFVEDSDCGSGTDEFGAYQGLNASHWAAAGAAVPSGSNNVAYAEGQAHAYVSMAVAP
jgi:hypothetical protein